MQNEKYLELDALAAPNGYVAPPTKEDLAYVVHFRKTCQRYQIDFANADSDERDFVILLLIEAAPTSREFIYSVGKAQNREIQVFRLNFSFLFL